MILNDRRLKCESMDGEITDVSNQPITGSNDKLTCLILREKQNTNRVDTIVELDPLNPSIFVTVPIINSYS